MMQTVEQVTIYKFAYDALLWGLGAVSAVAAFFLIRFITQKDSDTISIKQLNETISTLNTQLVTVSADFRSSVDQLKLWVHENFVKDDDLSKSYDDLAQKINQCRSTCPYGRWELTRKQAPPPAPAPLPPNLPSSPLD